MGYGGMMAGFDVKEAGGEYPAAAPTGLIERDRIRAKEDAASFPSCAHRFMRAVYILQSVPRPDRYYTGVTERLEDRIEEHNRGLDHHTRSLRPWQLVVAIQFSDRQKAFEFERYLKSGSGREFAKRHF